MPGRLVIAGPDQEWPPRTRMRARASIRRLSPLLIMVACNRAPARQPLFVAAAVPRSLSAIMVSNFLPWAPAEAATYMDQAVGCGRSPGRPESAATAADLLQGIPMLLKEVRSRFCKLPESSRNPSLAGKRIRITQLRLQRRNEPTAAMTADRTFRFTWITCK